MERKEKINKRIKEVLKDVHLNNVESKMPHELSGGEQQGLLLQSLTK